MPTRSKSGKPGERARDEARNGARNNDGHPKFAAGEWELADERDPDERFGKSRSDGGAPAEQYVRAESDDDVPGVIEDLDDDEHDPRDERDADDDANEPAKDAGVIETSASPSGMGRRGKPHKPAEREKPNPKPHTKTKSKASTRSGAKRRR